MNKKLNENEIKFVFDSHLAHFESIREKINLLTGLQNNIVNYSIAGIGGAIALFAFQDKNGIPILIQQPFMLATISVLMSMLTWASLEAEIRIHDFGRYMDNVLSKKIQKLIGQGELPDEYLVFQNEIAESSKANTIRAIARGILVSGKFMISFIPAVVALIVLALSFPNWQSSMFFWLAAVPALIVPIVLLVNITFIIKYYWQNQNKSSSSKKVSKKSG
jgi:hypothetical protein